MSDLAKDMIFCPACNWAMMRREQMSLRFPQDMGCPHDGTPAVSFYSYGSIKHQENWRDFRNGFKFLHRPRPSPKQK